ncbi:DUF2484 family protein [Lentibacter sp. XHP0401]|uniref:DUF2484 family protein n=1 Tax=Lentibacter sp. XHP0401 TaxID=2984334 RepID=UPI0021E92AF7|nr:DUF2484 family protein [Lentibacter sp. XHP0401]MCV2891633.1 DUF2484 family protein [Lentibacter sp. XHP0401]
MSAPLWAGVIWVIAATATAFLAIRRQFLPAGVLLVAAPAVILWIGYAHGWIFSAFAFAGFISMFRNPLRYLWQRVRGLKPELPK